MTAFIPTCIQDGNWLVRDPLSGAVASGGSFAEAYAALRRLLSARAAA